MRKNGIAAILSATQIDALANQIGDNLHEMY